MEITADIRIEELVAAVPQSVRVLARHGIVCIRCGEPFWGTLRELAEDKGIPDLGPVLDDLRRSVAES